MTSTSVITKLTYLRNYAELADDVLIYHKLDSAIRKMQSGLTIKDFNNDDPYVRKLLKNIHKRSLQNIHKLARKSFSITPKTRLFEILCNTHGFTDFRIIFAFIKCSGARTLEEARSLESAKCLTPIQKLGLLYPDRVKPITRKIANKIIARVFPETSMFNPCTPVGAYRRKLSRFDALDILMVSSEYPIDHMGQQIVDDTSSNTDHSTDHNINNSSISHTTDYTDTTNSTDDITTHIRRPTNPAVNDVFIKRMSAKFVEQYPGYPYIWDNDILRMLVPIKKYYYPVNVYFTIRKHEPYKMLNLTGNDNFIRAIRTYARTQGITLLDTSISGGKKRVRYLERDIFDAIGLYWITPKERNFSIPDVKLLSNYKI